MSKRLKLFLSYDTQDDDYFSISSIATFLEEQDMDIEKVFYLQRDTELGQTFKDYMREKIKISDLVLFFCSARSKESESVKTEVHYADAFEKIKVPIFDEIQNTFEDLDKSNGLLFNQKDFHQFCATLYQKITGKAFQSMEEITQDNLKNIEDLEQLSYEGKMVLGYFYVTKMEYYIGPYDYNECSENEESANFKNEAHIDLILKLLPHLERSQIKELINKLLDEEFLKKEEGKWSNKQTIFWVAHITAINRYDPPPEFEPIIKNALISIEVVYNVLKSNPLILEFLYLKDYEKAPDKYILQIFFPDLKDYKFLLLSLSNSMIQGLKTINDKITSLKDSLSTSVKMKNEDIVSKLGEIERVMLFLATNTKILLKVEDNIDHRVSQKTIDKWKSILKSTHPNFPILKDQLIEKFQITEDIFNAKYEWMIEMGLLTIMMFGRRVTTTKLGGYPILTLESLQKNEKKICSKIQEVLSEITQSYL